MAEYKNTDEIVKTMTKKFDKNYGDTTIKGIRDIFNMCVNCINQTPKADVIEIDKAAKVLAIVTGIAPCEMVSNEWLFDCCECIGYCGEISDVECWEQYLKHLKR